MSWTVTSRTLKMNVNFVQCVFIFHLTDCSSHCEVMCVRAGMFSLGSYLSEFLSKCDTDVILQQDRNNKQVEGWGDW